MSLNLNLALILEKCHVFKSSLVIFGFWFQDSRNNLELGIFQLLSPNSSSVTKIKWNWCPICQNWQKIGHFHAISRVLENSWKFPGMMKCWNSVLKIKFLDINWVGFIPYMLKSVKTSQFQGFSGILESWIPESRSHNIFQKVQKIDTNIIYRLVFWKFHQKPRKNSLFRKVVKYLGKSGSRKKTKSIDELILTWKFFSTKHESC